MGCKYKELTHGDRSQIAGFQSLTGKFLIFSQKEFLL
jgi:hypothetical protein